MKPIAAETIAIGDELTSGVRLDTNTQWISQQLDRLGIRVAFQTTVGDELDELVCALDVAARRASLVICTGGLGPTQDDLTRQAIAALGQVPLEQDAEVLSHIVDLFQRRGRSMPPNNEVQAWFPQGAGVIPNPEGTAPGIDFQCPGSLFPTLPDAQGPCRIFALPGVPAEMKGMWQDTVQPRLAAWLGLTGTTVHHTLHCFGAGESAIEMMLPDLVRRGRDPLVGITASGATISLRVSTRGPSESACREKLAPTLQIIRSALGDLVFGENGQQLEDVVVAQLQAAQRRIRVLDLGLRGEVARRLATADRQQQVLLAGHVIPAPWGAELDPIAAELPHWQDAEVRLMIGPIDRDPARVDQGDSEFEVVLEQGTRRERTMLPYRGHPSWRESRAIKEVLNRLRLLLLAPPQ